MLLGYEELESVKPNLFDSLLYLHLEVCEHDFLRMFPPGMPDA